jgi:hypothetical protein
MAAGSYEFSDWESDFYFLERYVYLSESGYVPPDYLQEIKTYLQEHHPEDAAFRFQRFSFDRRGALVRELPPHGLRRDCFPNLRFDRNRPPNLRLHRDRAPDFRRPGQCNVSGLV